MRRDAATRGRAHRVQLPANRLATGRNRRQRLVAWELHPSSATDVDASGGSSPKEKEMAEQQQPDRSKEHDRRNQQQQDEERRRREGISKQPSPSREDESEIK